MSIKYLDENGLLYVLQQIKNKYQAQEEGKGLSTCDYTPEEKEKLAGLSTVATSGDYNDLENIPTAFTPTEHKHSVGDFTDFSDELAKKENVIEDLDDIRSGAQLGATAQQPQTTLAGYGITDAYSKSEIDSKITSVMRYKGIVDNKDSLPSENNIIGDFYNTKDTGDNFAWDGEKWDAIGTAIDISGKQDVIEDIETIRSNASIGASLKNKVDGIASGAQVNIIESISLNSKPLEINNKSVDIVIATTDIQGFEEAVTKVQVNKAEKDSDGNTIVDTYATKVSVGTPDKDKSIQDEIDDLEALVGNISVSQQITNAIVNKIEESDLVAIANLEIAEIFKKMDEL